MRCNTKSNNEVKNFVDELIYNFRKSMSQNQYKQWTLPTGWEFGNNNDHIAQSHKKSPEYTKPGIMNRNSPLYNKDNDISNILNGKNNNDRSIFEPEADGISDYAHIGQSFNAFDYNKNGLLGFREICAGIKILNKGSSQEKIRLALHSLDIDNNDKLTPPELFMMFESILTTKGISHTSKDIDGLVKDCFNKYDNGQKGYIVFDEFKHLVHRRLQSNETRNMSTTYVPTQSADTSQTFVITVLVIIIILTIICSVTIGIIFWYVKIRDPGNHNMIANSMNSPKLEMVVLELGHSSRNQQPYHKSLINCWFDLLRATRVTDVIFIMQRTEFAIICELYAEGSSKLDYIFEQSTTDLAVPWTWVFDILWFPVCKIPDDVVSLIEEYHCDHEVKIQLFIKTAKPTMARAIEVYLNMSPYSDLASQKLLI